MKIAITGSTGLLGRRLMIALLERGHSVNAICRKKESITEVPSVNIFEWDAEGTDFPLQAINATDVVIHLAGEPIADSRWTQRKKETLVASRVIGTQKLVQALAKLPVADRPRHLLSASAIGIYGERGEESLSENSTQGTGFLVDVCSRWEAEANPARSLGMRVLHLRTGVVLSREGGALTKMQPVTLGSGKQWMSWIHIEDWQNIVLTLLENENLNGNVNLTAPHPVTQAEFTRAFQRAVGFKPKLRVPAFLIKNLLGEMSSIALDSQKVFPKAMLGAGFRFRYETIESAFAQLYGEQSYLDETFSSSQFVAEEVETVFPFFSDASNLEKITPPWLNFKIVNQSTPQIENHTLINYRLKIHGIPARWQSKISDWKPDEKFVDAQIKGPYSKWHHTHTFTAVPGGTLLGDHVIYRIPGNILGKTFLGAWIKNDVNTIFNYRRKVIDGLFGKKSLQ